MVFAISSMPANIMVPVSYAEFIWKKYHAVYHAPPGEIEKLAPRKHKTPCDLKNAAKSRVIFTRVFLAQPWCSNQTPWRVAQNPSPPNGYPQGVHKKLVDPRFFATKKFEKKRPPTPEPQTAASWNSLRWYIASTGFWSWWFKKVEVSSKVIQAAVTFFP